MRFPVAWSLCCLTLPLTLHAASFDCAHAERPLEKAVCAEPTLSAADSALARVYSADASRLSSSSIGLLRADQVQWLAWVQQLCHVDDPLMTPKLTAACLQPLYADRLKTLRKAVLRMDGLGLLMRTQYLAEPDAAALPGVPHPGFGTLEATWPMADTDDPAWVQWNSTVESRLLRMAQTGGPANPASPPAAAEWTSDLAAGTDVKLQARLKTVEHGRVTAGLSMEGMAHGGAHAYEGWQTLTWMLQPARALRVSDVFAEGLDWRSVVAADCWRQLHTSDRGSSLYQEVSGPGAKALQEVILNTTNWTLEQDGLHISYPEYSVAPRHVGVPDSIVPWPLLSPVLAHGFVQP